SPSPEESDDGIIFEETETGQNDPSQDESSETSSPSPEESDDGIIFEETETGQNDPSQDAISFNEGGSRQENQRSLARGSEEESDEPPTGSSAQGGGSESLWTSGAEGGSSTAAEEYLRKCTFTLYIQMDLMEMTLEDYIRRRNEGYLEKKSSALSEEDRRTARVIFEDLCWAVDFVHYRGFIHRDLKPSNVLLSPNENPRWNECPYSVRFSDFGLSTRLVRIPKELEESLDEDELVKVRRGLSHEPTERPTATDLLWAF
ncbi:unnamed protein product, partial [Cyprideis torosa]